MKKILSVFLTIIMAISILISPLNNITYGQDNENLPNEPTEVEIKTNKFVARLGEDIIYSIHDFGYENTETGIGADYLFRIFNMEDADLSGNKDYISSMKLKAINYPNIKIERFINNNWVTVDRFNAVKFRSSDHGINSFKDWITYKDEGSAYYLTREEIDKQIDSLDVKMQNIDTIFGLIYVLGEDEDEDVVWDHTIPINRMTSDGPIDFVYNIVDKPTTTTYTLLFGEAQWHYGSDNSTKVDAIPYNLEYLFFETSDISLSIKDEKEEYEPGDKLDLNVDIINKSNNLSNRRFCSGVDYGEKEIVKNPINTEGKPNKYFRYGEKNSIVILDTVDPGQTLRKTTEFQIPENISEEYLNDDGDFVITPFLYTSNISYVKDVSNDAFFHPEEREYNEPLIIKLKQELIDVVFDANGGEFKEGEDKLSLKVKKHSKLDEDSTEIPLKDGYKFDGWYLDEEFKDKFDFKNRIVEPTTIYAKWKKKSSGGGNGGGGGGGTVTPPTKPEETVDIDYVILANGDKYTDVLTATVLGNEIKAPILLTKVNYMDEDTKAEIKRLNPKNIIISGGDGSVSEKVIEELKDGGYKVERLSGVDRYETAGEIAKRVRNLSGVKDKAMLVDGTNFPDVITMSTLASQKHSPILLTEPYPLNKFTKTLLKDFNIKDITIGGESSSVSKDIEKILKKDYKVERIGGYDRYETASLIAKEVRKHSSNKDDLILVDGTNFPDGITINSLAGKYNSPIHLTNPKILEDITKKDIKDFNIKNILIGGGVASVSENTLNYLKGENIKTERISGSDRYKTAVKISEKFTEK